MTDACEIPKEIVSEMSTAELLLNTLNYPLIVDIFAYESDLIGYEMVSEYCTTLAELSNREDVDTAIEYAENNLRNYFNAGSLKYDIAVLALESIKFVLGPNNLSSNADAIMSAPVYVKEKTNNNVKTPNGTKIKHYEGLEYDCKDYYSGNTLFPEYSNVVTKQNGWLNAYPNLIVMGPISPKYNCHSYAWHSASTGNLYWINNPKTYWSSSDGSYVETSTAAKNRKLVYFKNSLVLHSAVFTSSGSTVISKWSYCGLFKHAISYCPYYNKSTARKKYMRAS